MQISRGKLDRLHRTPAESTIPGLDGYRTSQIRACSSDQRCLIFGFCPSGRGFASALLSDGASRRPPLRLASPSSPPDLGQRTFTSKLSNMLGTLGAVDAQNAPTAPWKSLRDSHKRPQPFSFVGENRKTNTSRACARVGTQTILNPPTAWPLFTRSSVAAFQRSVTATAAAVTVAPGTGTGAGGTNRRPIAVAATLHAAKT
jgi:hypothetical protein